MALLDDLAPGVILKGIRPQATVTIVHYLTKIIPWTAEINLSPHPFSPSNYQESDGNDLASPVRFL
jgi:hypothetical protein